MNSAALLLRMSKMLSMSKKYGYRFVVFAVLAVTGLVIGKFLTLERFAEFKVSSVKETELNLNDVKIREIKSKISEIKNSLNQDQAYALTQEDLAFLKTSLKNENNENAGNEQQELGINLAELQSWVKAK